MESFQDPQNMFYTWSGVLLAYPQLRTTLKVALNGLLSNNFSIIFNNLSPKVDYHNWTKLMNFGLGPSEKIVSFFQSALI